MASKKYSFLAGILCLLSSYGFAQRTTTTTTTTTTMSGTGYDVADSSVVSSKHMPQYTEFMNGTYNFPAKPRNMWELGLKGGIVDISGDVRSKPSFNVVGIHVRKALGYVFSLRLEYLQGVAKGLNWQPSANYSQDVAWADRYAGTPVYYNYRTELKDLSLEGIISLNNIRFHKANTGVNFYLLGGLGGLIYTSYINAYNDRGAAVGANGINPAMRYDFSAANAIQPVYGNRKQIKDALENILDNTYETKAERYNDRPTLWGHTLDPVFHLGGGVAFKLSNRFNLALEDRFTFTNDDLLDGQKWSEQGTPGTPVLSSHWDTYNYLTLGLNMNFGSKAVQPLWWVNPLDYAYQEIRKPRLMILPKPVLPDSDGDGVTDQFDQEQTPAGCPVDTHGVSLDTDGDGVPDCRDKEKVTPTICQPVDADGVGKCPCPDSSCFAKYQLATSNQCAASLGSLPSVTFSGSGFTLSSDARTLLATIASRLRNSPNCKVVVTGYCASSKAEQQRSWDRVNAVINYLVEKEGISSDRFFWQYGQTGGDCNTVDLRAASDADMTLPTTVPAPHPNLSRHHK